METEDAFLQALHDSSADEATWLVLSDWLEERGDAVSAARAELLRVRWALLHRPTAEERPSLEQRLQQLVAVGAQPCVPVLTNSIGMRLALIPAGTFWMGSPEGQKGAQPDERPQHEVAISRPFYLGAYTVTQEQYRMVVGSNPSDFQGAHAAGMGAKKRTTSADNCPVENVSYYDTTAFCERLSALPAEKAAGRTYRLPTEAEWEYSCRAGICCSPFHFGATLSSAQANLNGRVPDDPTWQYHGRPVPVGGYPGNAFGLYDMHGNVWEWCNDRHDPAYYQGAIGPNGPATGTRRVLRGGSYADIATLCRSALRGKNVPGYRSNQNGFRVALSWTTSVS